MTSEQNLESILDRVVNDLFRQGSRYAALLGFISFPLLFWMQKLGAVEHMEAPMLWSISGGSIAIIVSHLGKKRLLRGPILVMAVMVYVSIPSLLFGFAAFSLPSGAATFITGPASYLYMFMIAASGFAFQRNLSIGAGIFAGIQYFSIFWLSRPGLAALASTDSLMLQDLTSPEIYFFKSVMMGFTGLVIGLLSTTSKQLITRVLAEEREKYAISRLFGLFVSEEVKDKIIQEKTSNIAERKSVAILFSDIRGFTTLSESYEVEKLVLQLNEYLEEAVDCVTSNGGTVDKFIGDAIMAVFGGVIDLPNPCEAALQTAVQLRLRLQKLNENWDKVGKPALDNGVGIHFGEVVQGTIGSRQRKEFTVIGDPVNTASRIEGLCKEVQHPLIFSQEVYQRLEPATQSRCLDLGLQKVKGREGAVQIYGYQ